MEHRWGYRIGADVAVRLVVSPAAISIGRLRNVSVTGAFVETKLRPPLLSLIHVEIVNLELDPLASGSASLRRIAAFVVRQTSSGVGLEWSEGSTSSQRVEELLSTLRTQPPRFAPQELPIPARQRG